MIYFSKDPASIYRDIEKRIPCIKIKNKNFMNKYHNCDMPADFWWAISGEYAILAEYAVIVSAKDPRFLNDLKHNNHLELEISKGKAVSAIIINSIGKECILDKDFTLSLNVKKQNINELLIDDEKHFKTGQNLTFEKKQKLLLPMINLTNFLTQLRINKFKYLYLKVKDKIVSIYKNKNQEDNQVLKTKNTDEDFEVALETLLPDTQKKYFPKWFMWLSNYLVTSNHKWITKFGHDRDIYQIILNAKSYQKYGPKNIKVIPHGSTYHICYWHLFRFSLFPDMQLNTDNESLNLPKTLEPNFSEDILFCPMSFPFVCDGFSLSRFWEFMNVYRKVIALLCEGLKDNKKIKIRYKNFKYLSGFSGPFIQEENKIPVETKRFEEVYNKYRLIVSMPFGTISSQCYKNKVNCISFNYPFTLVNKQSYDEANTFLGVFSEGSEFLKELQKQIKKL